jgi:long-chain acyl-CoA synthetase
LNVKIETSMALMEQASRQREETLALAESLGEFVREQAALLGEQPAAVWFEQNVTLTYRDLDAQASRLADSLCSLGVRKGTHVAVMLHNSPAFPVTWIALGRLGAVMVPVNTAYTEDEVRFVLNDSDAQFLVIDDDLLERIGPAIASVPLLSAERTVARGGSHPIQWNDLLEKGRPDFVAPSAVSRQDLLNLQYTSGTTGFPKGCMLTHEYWMIHAQNSARHRRPPEAGIKNVLIWAPFFYMDPMWQLLMTLRLGGTAWIADRMSLSRFMDWLIDYRIHYCIFPEPALAHYPPSERDRQVALKYISIYGWTEVSRRAVQERFGVIAREGYGMTEIGTGSLVPAWASDKALLRTCGLPAAFRELRLRDSEGKPVADGEIGELWVRGRGLFLGYYKRPEANAQSFEGDWFRTGDLFRRDEDGFYYLVGRIKEMIKRAGENISANEVEAVLRSMHGISEAAVIAVPDDLRREEVKAYLKLSEGLTKDDIPPSTVLAHCRKHLAPFKVPRYLQYMNEDFPRTPSRKIAKKRLAADVGRLFADTYDSQNDRWLP